MNLNIQPFTNNLGTKIRFKSHKTIEKPQENKLVKTPKADTFEMSVGYVNDLHGQINNMMRILSGISGDLKLSAGDNDIGDEKNEKIHDSTTKFLNLADIKATALGNHELDKTQLDCIRTIEEFDGDMLSINFEQEPIEMQDDEDIRNLGFADLKSHLKKSKVVEVKGEKIALIGASPMDMLERLTHPNYYKNSHVDDIDKTVKLIQEEVDKYREQGINKIFLVSHLGHESDKVVAERVDGIDVIVSGHTHELLKDIKEGENLFYSKKTGEPIVVTEAGRDGNYFGLLNLKFNKDGVITQAQNNLGETRFFHKNLINQYLFDQILGTPEKVGFIQQAPPPPKNLGEENPHANFVCDVMREKTDSDIALWHHSGVRNFFHEGSIDSRDVKDLAPFLDYVVVAKVSEKTLVKAFKKAVEMTFSSPVKKPGLFAVSGMNYTVDPEEGELLEMNFIDKNGKEIRLDVDNPREDKFYKVVTDEFLMSAGADYEILADEDKYIKKYPYDKDVMTCEYIKEKNQPVIINQTGRIRFKSDD